MTKSDVVKNISQETGIISKDVAIVVNAFFEIIKEKMQSGNHIEIRHFGTFKLKVRKARMGRNPKTADKVPVPERVVPTFRFSREFKSDIAASVNAEEMNTK